MIPKEFEELPTSREILRDIINESKGGNHLLDVEWIIKKAQKDTRKACIRWCAENAKVTNESTEHITGYLTSEFVVDKQSILNGLIE